MGLFKRILSFVVAGETKRCCSLLEKILFVGTVGKMAGPATLALERLMDDLLLVTFAFMTLIAHFAAFALEKVARLRCMRVVAENAFPRL